MKVVLEGLTKQVDNAFVISSKEPDGVFEEEHEGCVDDSISQLVGIDLRESNQPSLHTSSTFIFNSLTYKDKACVGELRQCISLCCQHVAASVLFTTRAAELQEVSPQTHIEIEEGIHLVLNNGDGLEQLLCIHGPHYAIHSVWTHGESRGRRGERWMEGGQREDNKQCSS